MITGHRRTLEGVECVEVHVSDLRRKPRDPINPSRQNDVCHWCPLINTHCDSSCGDSMVWVPIITAAVWALEE